VQIVRHPDHIDMAAVSHLLAMESDHRAHHGDRGADAMTRHEAEEYTQTVGKILGGSWRQIALAKKLGVPKTLGLSEEKWVNDRLGGYVKLAVEDRRSAAAIAERSAAKEVDETTAQIMRHIAAIAELLR
jgi:hypothetical protein